LSHHWKLYATTDLLSSAISGAKTNPPLAVDLRNCDFLGYYSTCVPFPKQSSEGRRKTTPQDDRILFRSANRRQTLKDVTARFNQRNGCIVSSRTVCRRLFREGYTRRVVSKKITISQVNCQRWVGFCRRKLHWIVDQWSHIIFSDETKIILGQNRKIYVWRKADERLRPECVGRPVSSPGHFGFHLLVVAPEFVALSIHFL
jgi:hypothetical protein